MSDYAAFGALLSGALAMGLFGMGRSLWLDEAWVANSVLSPSLGEMFHYPEWLQTSPPLFLLLARAVVDVFGASNVTLRIAPLLLSLAGIVAMFAAARRLLSPAGALLACAVLAFHPVSMEYSRTFKQYSGEMAASAMLLWMGAAYFDDPVPRRLAWLMACIAVGLGLGYSTVFLWPGLLAVVAIRDRRKGLVAAGFCAALLAVAYFALLRGNVSPNLRAFWSASEESMPAWITVVAAVVATWFAWGVARGRDVWIGLIGVTPWLLLASAEWLGWYPASPRTRLFALPGLVIGTISVAEQFLRGKWRDRAALLGAAALAVVGMWTQVRENRDLPFEDVQGAMRYLRAQVQPNDLLLVHASNRETFRLYASREGWSGPQPLFGDTGWPCCARDENTQPGASRQADVIRDLNAKVPRAFSGRVWVFFTTRPEHWKYTGVDEGDLWRRLLWEGGCPPAEYVEFQNLAVSPMDCRAFRGAGMKE